MHRTGLTRREGLQLLAGAAAGLMAGGTTESAAAAWPVAEPRRRQLRVAHLTDIHVQPERRGGEGMAACLRHIQELADPPDLILTGGDSIMDSLATDDARTQLQWDLWHKVLRDECSLTVRSCIGNHDVWGWMKSKSNTTGDEPGWGKRRAVDMLRIEDRYYTFAQEGWQFVVLDSTQPPPDGGEGYTAHVDEAQYDWLARTLRDVPSDTPVLVLSHIPILSASALLWAAQEQGNFQISGSLMHTDCLKLKELFAQHPNVKLCLSGHLHLVDRVDYNGVTYLCNGAVSGQWWKGRHKDCDEGYAVLNLYDDGSFEREYVTYGWEAVGGRL